jgi:hypothetical protein
MVRVCRMGTFNLFIIFMDDDTKLLVIDSWIINIAFCVTFIS